MSKSKNKPKREKKKPRTKKVKPVLGPDEYGLFAPIPYTSKREIN